MNNILSKIENLREEAQAFQLYMDASPNSSAGGGGQSSGGPQTHGHVSGGGRQGPVHGLLAYKPPRHDKNCRICNTTPTIFPRGVPDTSR